MEKRNNPSISGFQTQWPRSNFCLRKAQSRKEEGIEGNSCFSLCWAFASWQHQERVPTFHFIWIIKHFSSISGRFYGPCALSAHLSMVRNPYKSTMHHKVGVSASRYFPSRCSAQCAVLAQKAKAHLTSVTPVVTGASPQIQGGKLELSNNQQAIKTWDSCISRFCD